MYEIESGIEVPEINGGPRGPWKYPWLDMNVGDSFLAEDKTSVAMSSVARQAGKRYGMKFTVRTAEGGVRVWRVE